MEELMGVTIHYQGRLRDAKEIDALIDEVVDIAETLGWPHREIRADLRGVSVHPHPECDSFALLFDERGSIRNPVLETDGFFCKTQFAPASVHVALVKLLRHLGDRWFDELVVEDEGGYWQTRDLGELNRRRQTVGRAIQTVAQRLRGAPAPHPEEREEDVATRIERILAEHEGRPIDPTEDEHRRVLGPGGPDPEEAAGWDVDRWVEYFRSHDEEKSPLLREMKGRVETEAELAEALRRAEEEDRKDEEAMFKYLAKAEQELQESEPEPEEGEPAWSLPVFDAEEEPEEEEDEAERLAREFARQFHARLRGRPQPHPVTSYASALLASTLVGVRMGFWWARESGTRHPVAARRRLAAERFRAIARLLRSFPTLELDDLAAGAERVSRAFERT